MGYKHLRKDLDEYLTISYIFSIYYTRLGGRPIPKKMAETLSGGYKYLPSAKVREGEYNVLGGILLRIPLYAKSMITSPATH